MRRRHFHIHPSKKHTSDDSTFQVIDILNVYKFNKEDYFFSERKFSSIQHNVPSDV